MNVAVSELEPVLSEKLVLLVCWLPETEAAGEL